MVYPRHQPAQSSQHPLITLLPNGDWGRYTARALRAATESVKLSIFLISHRWASTPRTGINMLDELVQVAARGIDCRAIIAQVNTKLTPDTPNVGAVRILLDAGWNIRMTRGRIHHEKVIIVDKHCLIVGSHNISGNSLYRNNEMSVGITCTAANAEAKSIWWQRWREAQDAEKTIEEIVKYGARKSTRTTATTGGEVLKIAGISPKRKHR